MLAAALLGVLGTLTWQQATLYHDGITFFNHVIAQNHRAREAHLNLGTALLKWNLLDEAEEAYLRALRICPRYAAALAPPEHPAARSAALRRGAGEP